MATKRTYADACGIARALDLVGGRWALMIVRELLLGPKRFTDIRDGLPSLSSDVLAQRLRELEDTEIVRHRKLPPPIGAKVYELTDRGRALEPVLIALGRWGGTYATPPDEEMCMSLDAHIVSLRTLFDPALAEGFAARIALRLDQLDFRVVVREGQIEAERGELVDADATIETDPATLIAVLHGHRPLADAVGGGDLRIEGDTRVAERFVRLFPLPVAAG
jgi:DNA-binding HxlR family transcriptional regulator